jgi:hypothetical protein
VDVQLRHPDVQVRDLSLAELVDYLLDYFQFFAEDLFFEGTGGEGLDSRCDDLVFVAY